ncbi:transporter [Paraflavisolibacter sp. H34]|uniref:transporter n=1 Tax=Huijunlia imazamoxiresistens TaxID=3127457 RepID=UPI003018B3EF
MKRKQCGLFAVMCLLAGSAFAQEDRIESDRPGQTQTPGLTSKGYLQVEAGIEKDQERDGAYMLRHPEAVLKFGLSDRWELRTELTSETWRDKVAKEYHYGLKPVEVGFKAKLAEEKGMRPATSLYTLVGLPALASRDHRVSHVFPTVRLLFKNQLTGKLELDYNIGPEWDGEQAQPQWLYSVDPEWKIGEKWEAFLEVFGYLQKGKAPQHHLDGGLAYFPSNDLKIDLFGGKGISAEAPDYFISLGVSFRLRP